MQHHPLRIDFGSWGQNHIAWSANREGEKWKFHITSHSFNDMHHPAEGKASLIYLKRHGDLKLRFQQPDSSWQEVTAQLGPKISTRETFTHAAFASNNGTQPHQIQRSSTHSYR